jgi:hypothetical protein
MVSLVFILDYRINLIRTLSSKHQQTFLFLFGYKYNLIKLENEYSQNHQLKLLLYINFPTIFLR